MIKVFRINGAFGEKANKQKFAYDVRALNVEQAKEKTYADFGSRHKMKRRCVSIKSVTEIKPEESKSNLVAQLSEVE